MERFERLVDILLFEDNDLRKLAEIAEANPKTFFRACDMSGTDLRGTDLRGFDLTDSVFDGVQTNHATKVDDEFERYLRKERASVTIRVDGITSEIERYIYNQPFQSSGQLAYTRQLVSNNFFDSVDNKYNLYSVVKKKRYISEEYMDRANTEPPLKDVSISESKNIKKFFLRCMLSYAVNNKTEFLDMIPQSFNRDADRYLISIPREHREHLNVWAKEMGCSRAELIRRIIQKIVHSKISVMKAVLNDSGEISFLMERGTLLSDD